MTNTNLSHKLNGSLQSKLHKKKIRVLVKSILNVDAVKWSSVNLISDKQRGVSIIYRTKG